jgi:hypothetical protein
LILQMTGLMPSLTNWKVTMTNRTLSPAAQAVLDAFLDSPVDAGNYYATRSRQIAAALRAAADQVVPEFWHEDDDVYGETMQDIRQQLLAIAAELEGGG